MTDYEKRLMEAEFFLRERLPSIKEKEITYVRPAYGPVERMIIELAESLYMNVARENLRRKVAYDTYSRFNLDMLGNDMNRGYPKELEEELKELLPKLYMDYLEGTDFAGAQA